jgi:hypothetical protein
MSHATTLFHEAFGADLFTLQLADLDDSVDYPRLVHLSEFAPLVHPIKPLHNLQDSANGSIEYRN